MVIMCNVPLRCHIVTVVNDSATSVDIVIVIIIIIISIVVIDDGWKWRGCIIGIKLGIWINHIGDTSVII